MTHQEGNAVNRRSLLRGTAATAGLVLTGGMASQAVSAERRRAIATVSVTGAAMVKTYANADFYDAAKTFLADKAKQAYFDMFARFGYPLPDSLRKGMWVQDFAMDDFIHAGMGGIFWLNRKEYGYMGHDIYLLPGQMIPEHTHLKTAGPAKMESWHVRHGMI